MSIYEIIPTGRENAMPRRELMSITGLTDRELRRAISRERFEGKLILSSVDRFTGGYYKPATTAEIKEFIALMSKHARATFAVLKASRAVIAASEAEEKENGAK